MEISHQPPTLDYSNTRIKVRCELDGNFIGGKGSARGRTIANRLARSHCFCALRKPIHGTFKTCRRALRMSAFEDISEVHFPIRQDQI
jgi:hypothetical protein